MVAVEYDQWEHNLYLRSDEKYGSSHICHKSLHLMVVEEDDPKESDIEPMAAVPTMMGEGLDMAIL